MCLLYIIPNLSLYISFIKKKAWAHLVVIMSLYFYRTQPPPFLTSHSGNPFKVTIFLPNFLVSQHYFFVLRILESIHDFLLQFSDEVSIPSQIVHLKCSSLWKLPISYLQLHFMYKKNAAISRKTCDYCFPDLYFTV